ncbi:hypothetical protein Lal_00045873 [Lupinus albus]|uniref:Avr9/Cf-9 rapidly elicited protein n=1 Tax=Lupinus albus TaxID=3870 RepID=A0A6A4PG37_LUPAL|nr:hypothetical protein Lalb_Chr14g0373061 [Lupinus albus]KAE9600458.1 hypothetical protein Lalb_Chr14g0373071 [Lupinus albus]KAF1886583.1 hypothetical protein Lal_00045816 [Lupinus albus]KAF1886640.1 hypothetical protein Lal_00045873 [Lupinus albus]
MENNLPIIAKRVWSMVHVVIYMLRKGFSKGKLMMDLNMVLKRRGKLAGKAIANLMFHHHHNGGSTSSRRDSNLQFNAQREYEFSCSNTPNHFFPIGGKRNRNHNHNHNQSSRCAHVPPSEEEDMNAVKAVLEMLNMNNSETGMVESLYSSPALSGFGKSPMVRQLRVTDSPFPLAGDDKDNMVDKKADEFIKRFYKQLRNQD